MKAVLLCLALGIIGFFGYSSLKPAKKPVLTGKGVVYYYPKANIYYDVASYQYVFFDSTEKIWKQTKKISEEQKLSLGERATIAKPATPVWKNNADDKLVYSMNLYSSRSDLKEKFYTDSINSLPKKVLLPAKPRDTVATPANTDEAKPKKGLKKFFDKLFGKKEKSDSGG
jgi:hypothetical protein